MPSTEGLLRGNRRGALLLLVLGALTIFMMTGTLMLVLAARARTTARAFAGATAGSGSIEGQARAALDAALLTLLRGAKDESQLPTAMQGGQSLLEDQYGTATKGSLTAIRPVAGTPLLEAVITGITPTNPLTLSGRVVTFKPRAEDPADVSSYRILRFDSGRFLLAALRSGKPKLLPTSLPPCDAFVNGPEFAGTGVNESWDAFDAQNPFLTQPLLKGDGRIDKIERPAYGPAGGSAASLTVDNDNDGVADGIWLDGVVPPAQDVDGGIITFSVSYLVLDLDGRLNLNAHGASPAGSATDFGPAALDPQAVIPAAAWDLLVKGGQPAAKGVQPTADQRRAAPLLGNRVDGRIGSLPTLGTYDLRLDLDGPRMANVVNRTDAGNPFTASELERILRPYDADAATLAPRLAAILDDRAESLRMLVTSDSWDTPGLTGATGRDVLQKADPTTSSGDIATGLRFNLNRELPKDPDSPEKQQYMKDLFALIVACGGQPNEETAQWVANVADFRDSDSTPTSFKVPGDDAVPAVQGIEPPPPPAEMRQKLPAGWDHDFNSHLELLAVPKGKLGDVQQMLKDGTPVPSLAQSRKEILEATIVPSRFRGSSLSVPPNTLDAVGMDQLPKDQLSRWREPGRINVNTCDDAVWKILVGQSGPPNPFRATAAGPASVAQSDRSFLIPALVDDSDAAKFTPAVANRLGNVATTRSHVFGVWVTVKVTPAPAAVPVPPIHRRLFAIVDRSIPVGLSRGEDLNVRDTIRLLRYLD